MHTFDNYKTSVPSPLSWRWIKPFDAETIPGNLLMIIGAFYSFENIVEINLWRLLNAFHPFFFKTGAILSKLTPSISFASKLIKADPLSIFQLCSTSLNSSHLNFPLNNLR